MSQINATQESLDRAGQRDEAALTNSQPDAHFGKVCVVPVKLSGVRIGGIAETVYRAFEIVLASIALIIALPLMLAIAIIICVDSPGPALFWHRRPAQSVRMRGRDLEGRGDLRPPPGGFVPDEEYWAPAYFTLIKFRTMYRDARTRFPTSFPDSYAREDFRTRFPYVENDPRITRVGRLLRKLSVDELPNLWSVVVGDIRLVGPRPELPQVLQYHTPDEMLRFTCKPGITGLAQIGGRKMLNWGETLKLDLEYVRTRTVALDLKIILLTIRRVITAHGAL